MGFNIIGVSPQSKTGVHFANDDLPWKFLWNCVCDTCGEFLTWREMDEGESNNGYQIVEEKSLKISKRLFELLESGVIRKRVKYFHKQFLNMPLEVCNACKGTGMRYNQDCPICLGKGKIGRFITEYEFNEDNVRAFAEFCSSCGGFIIS